MIVFIYIIELIATFFAIWGLNSVFIKVFEKKFSKVISAFLTFVVTIFIAFILAPYLLSFSRPSIFYLPFSLFWLIWNLIKASSDR